MRTLRLILVALPATWLSAAIAQQPTGQELQELLCEQCPFDAPVRHRRSPDNISPTSTNVITDDDMKELGVISVADMISQLPAAADSDTPDDTALEPEASSGRPQTELVEPDEPADAEPIDEEATEP